METAQVRMSVFHLDCKKRSRSELTVYGSELIICHHNDVSVVKTMGVINYF